MALTEADKKKIEDEEHYRSEIRKDLSQNKPKKKGVGFFKGLFFIIIIFIAIGAVATAMSPSMRTQNDTPPNPQPITEEDKSLLAKTFCDERSKPNVRSVKFTDFIAMYEKHGGTVMLNSANGAYPSKDDCKKIADICLALYHKEDCDNIATRKIWVGMTKDQLILSWGLPNDRNNTTGNWGIHTQWVYGDFGPYAYLEGQGDDDLKVTSWQD